MFEAEREVLAQLCRTLHQDGILTGSEGNISIRTASGEVILTPSSKHKGSLLAGDMLVTDLKGSLIEGAGRVTKEYPLHRMIYEKRADVNCIIHAHPVYGTVYAVLGEEIPSGYLVAMQQMVGETALAAYAPAGSQALVDAVEPLIDGHDMLILKNHGVLICGKSAEDALCRTETAENAAHTMILAEMCGKMKQMPE